MYIKKLCITASSKQMSVSETETDIKYLYPYSSVYADSYSLYFLFVHLGHWNDLHYLESTFYGLARFKRIHNSRVKIKAWKNWKLHASGCMSFPEIREIGVEQIVDVYELYHSRITFLHEGYLTSALYLLSQD